jgi:hypothetical protein
VNKLVLRVGIVAFGMGAIALFAWGLVYVDGLFGVNHIKGFQFHIAARRWTLQRVDATPEQVNGVVAGMRVKAVLDLSADIQTDSATFAYAAAMPFGLDPGLRSLTSGLPLFFTRSEPVIRKEGQIVPTRFGIDWVQAGALPKGVYEVEQVFWMAGVRPLQSKLSLLSLVRTAYFKAHNTTPYRDLTQVCRDHEPDLHLNELTRYDKQVARVNASAWFFNGDRIRFKDEHYATERKATTFAYNHGVWMDALRRIPLQDCNDVYQQVKNEVAAMEVQLADLKVLKDQLQWAAEWSKDTATSSKVELVTRDITQEELLQQFSGIACQGDGVCRSQGLACQVTSENVARERFPRGTQVRGVVHSTHPIDSTAYLKDTSDSQYYLFLPDQPEAEDKLCMVVTNNQRLVDPQSLARSASATMQCGSGSCDVMVPQWRRDPGWLSDKARRLPEIASRLAKTEAALKLAESF